MAGGGAGDAGAVEESDAAAAQAVAEAEALGHPFTSAYVDVLAGWRAVWLDRPDDAADRTDRALATARRHGYQQLEAFAMSPAGWAAARQGDVDGGERLMVHALEIFGSLPAGHMLGHLMWGVLADVRRGAGAWDAALEALTQAFADSERTGERFYLAELHRMRGEVLRALGADREAVAASMRAAADVAEAQGAGLFLARVGAPV